LKKNKDQKIQKTVSKSHLAIIGIGCLFPKADSLEAYWANISNGVDAITDVPETHWQADNYYGDRSGAPERLCTSRGGFISPVDFSPIEFGIPPNALEAIDTSQLLGLIVTQQALKDAGYKTGDDTFDRDRVSVIMGVTGTLELVIPLGARLGHPIWRKSLKEAGVDDATIEEAVQRISSSYVPWQENSFPGLLGNVVAGRIANHFDLGGTNCVIDAACASSLSAMHLASLELLSGRSDMVITGGVDTFNDVFMFTCFNETQALSPSGNARPFDTQADGTILGEGLGVLVIKRLEDARKDNDRIYAVIRGIGTSSDGKGQAIYAPSPHGQAIALQNAYKLSNVPPETIELVEAHGTGTKAGDIAEISALTEVYRKARSKGTWCALGSVKSQIGHTKAAAGVAGIIKASMALHHKVLPPTIKVDHPPDKLSSGLTPFYVNTQKRPWLPQGDHPRRAAVSSFGFGGSNFHCVLEEFSPDKTETHWDGQIQILSFSAESQKAIQVLLKEWPSDIAWDELRHKAEDTRKAFNAEHTFRLLLVVEKGRTDITKVIANASTMLTKYPQKKSWSTPDGAYFGTGAPEGKLGVIFPGQGSQYVGMFRDLACSFPQMQRALEETNLAFATERDETLENYLIDYIYPHPVFSKEAEKQNEEALRSTRIAQPAIGAVSFGALKVLDYFGVQADAVAGHSYGELTALCASERMDFRAFFSLSMLRGQLMGEGNGDKGAMLATQAPLDLAQKVIREEKLDLVIANKNAPNQTVLSGSTGEIEKAAHAFKKIHVRNTRLPVSGAFHSSLVAHVKEPFLSALRRVEFSETKLPVFANITAVEYPQGQEEVRNILASQLVSPIEFVKEIENMYESGIRTFLECGPGAKLTGLIKSIMQGREYSALSIDASSGEHSGQFDLASTLAFLAANGYNVMLNLWDDIKKDKSRQIDSQKPRMTIPICGANYINPKSRKPSLDPKKSYTSASPVNSELSNKTVSENSSAFFQTPLKAPKDPHLDSSVNPSSLADALRMTQENMARLQTFQEQTTQLHKQFLEGQTAAQRTFQSLVEQQQNLIQASLGIAMPEKKEAFIPTMPEVDPSPTYQAPSPTMPSFEHNAKSDYPPLDMPPASSPAVKDIIIQPTEQSLGSSDPGPAEQTNIPSSQALESKKIEIVLLEVVAEKTGYPVEMLELDMELDSDLGIDSIKRVEILSDIQEKLPEAPEVKPEHLGSLKTLRQIVEFLSVPLGTSAEGMSAPSNGSIDQTRVSNESDKEVSGHISGTLSFSDNSLERRVLSCVKVDEAETREPFSVAAGSRIWITDEDTGLASDIKEHLISLKYSPEIVPLKGFEDKELPSDLGGLLILSPSAFANDAFIKDSFRLLKHAGPALRNAGKNGGSVLLTVSRMDGYFGLTSLNGQNDPASGGISGLLKTASHEWREVNCKSLDLAGDYEERSKAVSTIIEEMFISGPLEVGLTNKGKYTLELNPVPINKSSLLERPPIGEGDVVVITGGARGVTAEVATSIAKTFQPTLVLLGRSEEPGPEPDWLVSLTDEADIKKQILNRANGNSSPKKIEEQYLSIIANRELLSNIRRIESAGSRVVYCSVDVRDQERVQAVLTEVRQQVGPIKGLIHGAGVIADRLIEDKTDEQFDFVYSTKVAGLRSLLKAMEQDDLKIMVLFSSTTGRYGRSGQVDYAVANEVLNKFAQQQARVRPKCRVVSVNWGPWDGGMVNPSLRKIFEQEGIGLINLEAGANYLLQEICSNGGAPPVEVVVMGKSNGNSHSERNMHQTSSSLPVAFELQLNILDFPFLKSHVMNGRSVLPMAMIIEWLAHGALHGNPGMKFAGFDNLRILKGLTLDENETRAIRILAGKGIKNGATRKIPVELTGSSGNGSDYVHARADIVLTTKLPQEDNPITEISLSPYNLKRDDIYNGLLFHGSDFHGIKQVEGYSEQGISATAKAAPSPSSWIKRPLRSSWLADPLIVDSSFQMMILWSLEKNGVGSLPSFAGHYRQFQSSFPDEGARIIIRITQSSEHKALADIDYIDPVEGRLIARMEGYECVIDASLNCAFRCNELPGKNEKTLVDSL